MKVEFAWLEVTKVELLIDEEVVEAVHREPGVDHPVLGAPGHPRRPGLVVPAQQLSPHLRLAVVVQIVQVADPLLPERLVEVAVGLSTAATSASPKRSCVSIRGMPIASTSSDGITRLS